MEHAARTLAEQLVRWAVGLTGMLASWDTPLLIALAITLTVLAGVTGRAVTGGGILRQTLWIMTTTILTLCSIVVVWVLAARYLPIPELTGMLQRLAAIQATGMD